MNAHGPSAASCPGGAATARNAAVLANYERLARWYDALVDPFERRARAIALRLLEPRAGEQILDIGCGTGAALSELARAVGSSGRATGIDLSPRMAARAMDRLARADRGPNSLVTVAGVPPLPFDDGSFDAIFMSFTLEVIKPDSARAALLSECGRVLRRGGRMVCATVSGREPSAPASRLYRAAHRRFGSVVDCAPIRAADVAASAGFVVTDRLELHLWGLPIDVIRVVR